MISDNYARCREAVSAAAAAERYGLRLDRRGRALCPFHDDHRPSMSFRGGRFRCWSCGAAGDSVDLTARLLGLTAAGALRRLDADFHLGLEAGPAPPSPEAQRAAEQRRALRDGARQYADWREEMLRRLCLAIRVGSLALRRGGALTEAEARAVYHRAALTAWADALDAADMDRQMTVFRDREEIDRICREILNATQTRSETD